MTLRIAITGGSGAGKSLLAGWLRAAGHPVLDADEIGREVVDGNPELRAALAEAFGAEILDGEGALRRTVLGRRVFADSAALEKLNALVFPYLGRRLQEGLELAGGAAVFMDAALVFEWGVADWFDEVWVLTAPADLRLRRTRERLGLAEGDVRGIQARQLSQDEKAARADRVLDNGGPALQLWIQADREVRRLGLAGLPASTRPASELDQVKDPACTPPSDC